MPCLGFLGATGRLGQEIAEGLKTASGYDTFKAIVRAPAVGPKVDVLKKLGYEIVTTDLDDADELAEALTGVDTLVSTIGGPGLWRLETAIVKASVQAGVSLFVPSQFDVDRDRFGTEDPFMKAKANIVQSAREQGLNVLVVNCGYLSDSIFDVVGDPWNGEVQVVDSDSPAKITFTCRRDVGYVLAAALADPAYAEGGTLCMEGETLYWKDAVETLMSVMKDVEFDVRKMSVEDASNKAEVYVEKGKEGDVWNSFKAFGLHLLMEPAKGNDGADMSDLAKNYGHKMSTLQETLAEVYKPLPNEDDEE